MEDEKVLCPYCGNEMRLEKAYKLSLEREFYSYYYCNKCRSCSPSIKGNTYDESIENARITALKRYKPMQKPLSLEEVKALEFPFPLWIEYKEIRFDNGEKFHPEIVYGILADGFVDIGYDWINPESYQSEFRFWREKPTDAERAAAKWEE